MNAVGKKKAKKADEGDYTSVRILTADRRLLSELAAMLDLTVADCYHQVCGPAVIHRLKVVLDNRSAALKNETGN